MKIWTFNEMATKIEQDLDLKEETFITRDEIAGYFNEALTEAEAEIMDLNKDYFLTKYFVPMAIGKSQYDLPSNIFANKIRDILYINGSTIYEVRQYRRQNKFTNMAFTDQYGGPDDYQYLLINDVPGQAKLEIHPASRDTAILPPLSSPFIPMVMWYYRNCARVPLIGDFCNPEVIPASAVTTAFNQVTVSGITTIGVVNQGVTGVFPGAAAYVTGDQVKVKAGPGCTLPGGLDDITTYYLYAPVGNNIIKFCTTLANALVGTAITLSTQGTGFFTISIKATLAIQNATILDIPEWSTFVMQWVKCSCLPKEGDPRLDAEATKLKDQKESMINSLVNAIVDDDDTIQPDFSHYNEMS